ncbi:MAG: hypothetical protein ACE5JJ_01460 [Nitrospinota bacterium]
MRKAALAGVVGLVLLAGCGEEKLDAEATAARFVGYYYVAIDLPSAQKLTEGLARSEIERQMLAVKQAGAPIAGAKPKVESRILERRQSDGRVMFLFALTIQPAQGRPFERRALISVSRRPGGWRVTHFREFDLR